MSSSIPHALRPPAPPPLAELASSLGMTELELRARAAAYREYVTAGASKTSPLTGDATDIDAQQDRGQ